MEEGHSAAKSSGHEAPAGHEPAEAAPKKPNSSGKSSEHSASGHEAEHSNGLAKNAAKSDSPTKEPPSEEEELRVDAASPALGPSANLLPRDFAAEVSDARRFEERLEAALEAHREKRLGDAENLFIGLLTAPAPTHIHRKALMELGTIAHERRDFPRAQQIFAQYVARYRDDPSLPEVHLLQGLVYREMGAHTIALQKFFVVMSSALSLSTERAEYYERLVLRAQTEIADTYFLQGDFKQAVDFFTRLLKLPSAELNRAQVSYKLIRALRELGRLSEVVSQSETFVSHFADARELPEVRFILAEALKRLGRNREAVGQVLALLTAQEAQSSKSPENWIHWQQRTGNEIGNQLYEEGDYFNALEIYLRLSALSDSPTWQFPVWYQIALIYERLHQPERALETYARIEDAARRIEAGTSTPALTALQDMARWRAGRLRWEAKAEKDVPTANLKPIESPATAQREP